jgi:hypothetical protein
MRWGDVRRRVGERLTGDGPYPRADCEDWIATPAAKISADHSRANPALTGTSLDGAPCNCGGRALPVKVCPERHNRAAGGAVHVGVAPLRAIVREMTKMRPAISLG